jgi:hypothetical protein
MPHRLPLLAVAVTLLFTCLAVHPASAVVVHGLDWTAAGAASVLDEPVPGTDRRRLVASGIGSSGEDGVNVTLPGSRDCVLALHTLAGAPEGESFAFHRFPSDATPVIRGSALGGNGTARVLGVEVAATTVTVELWHAGQLKLSQAVPVGTPVIVSGYVTTADTGRTFLYKAKQGSTGSTKREISLDQSLPAGCDAEVLGFATACDRVVFSATLDGAPEAVTQARLRFTSSGAPAAMAVTRAHVGTGGAGRRPPGAYAPVAAMVLSGALHLADTEPGALSYSTAVAADSTSISWGTVHAPRIELKRVRAQVDQAAIATLTLPVLDLVASGEDDDGSGLPPTPYEVRLRWDSGAGTVQVFASSSSDAVRGQVRIGSVASGGSIGKPTLLVGSPPVGVGNPPLAFELQRLGGDLQIHAEFAPGTMIDLDGTPLAGEQLVLSVGRGSGTRTIRDIRIVHPPGTPPGTWRLTGLECMPEDQGTPEGGRDVAARGPRQTTSLDGSYASTTGSVERRIPVRNIGSSGEDGVEVHLRGAPSASFELLEDAADTPAAVFALRSHACPSGYCDPLEALDLELSGTTARVRDGVFGATVQQPFDHCRVDGRMLPYASVDLDDDGWVDLVSTTPGPVRVAAMRYASRDDGSSAMMQVEFAEPVAVTLDDGVQVVSELEFWRNPGHGGGGSGGAGGLAAQVVSLNGLPPGTPVPGRFGACDFGVRPPALLSSGHGMIRSDIGVLRHGLMTRSTWATGHGPVILGNDSGGDLRVMTPSVREGEAASLQASSRWGAECAGFLMEVSPPLGLVWSPRSNVELRSRGDFGGMVDAPLHALAFDVTSPDGAYTMRYREVPAGAGAPRVRVYLGGVLVTEQAADSAVLSAPPAVVFTGGDLDGDGRPEVVARALPGGTVVTIAGSEFVGDELRWQPTDPVAVDGVRSAALHLDGLAPGIPLEGVRLAGVVPGTPSVGVGAPQPRPGAMVLGAAHPNPARDATRVRLALGRAARVRAEVLDVAGRSVRVLTDRALAAGEYALEWDGRTGAGLRAAPGLYLVRCDADGLASATARVVWVE